MVHAVESLLNSLRDAISFVFVVPTGYPQDFSIEVLSSRSALLSWIPPLIEEQNGIIIRYVVRVVAIESGADFQVPSGSIGVRIDTLEPNTMYMIFLLLL